MRFKTNLFVIHALWTFPLAVAPSTALSQYLNDEMTALVKEQLTGLTPAEKKSVVLCVRGAVSINFKATVAPNLKAGGADAAWALNISAAENALMSGLSTEAGWSGLANYYDVETELTVKLIKGKYTFEQYRDLTKENLDVLKRVFDIELAKIKEHERNFQRFQLACRLISNGIIFIAKNGASSQ